MRKALFIVLTIIGISGNCPAQSEFFDSTRNEIGVTLLPVLSLFEQRTVNPDILLQYKRHFKNTAFRISANVGNKESTPDFKENQMIKMNDSVNILYDYTAIEKYYKLKSGLEYARVSGNRWRTFVGADLVFGYHEIINFENYTAFTRDKDSLFKEDLKWSNDAKEIQRSYYGIGINPFGGFEYFVSQRVSLSLFLNLECYYQFEPNSINTQSTLSFDENMHIMLIYHFGKKKGLYSVPNF